MGNVPRINGVRSSESSDFKGMVQVFEGGYSGPMASVILESTGRAHTSTKGSSHVAVTHISNSSMIRVSIII